MKKSLKNNELGITLMALVITIVILLILVGVSLNLVLGEQGITKRAITAGEQYDIAGAKEQAELLVASYAGNFYQEKYISENSEVTTIGDYVSEQLKNGEITGDYTVKTADKKITIIKDENELISGTLNDDGTIDWTKTPFDPNTITIGTAVDVDKYGWKVDYVSRYEEDNDTTLGWRLFYKDSNFAYIISDILVGSYKPSDYFSNYPNGSTVGIMGKKLNSMLEDNGTFFIENNTNENVKSTIWLTDIEYWKNYKDTNNKALYVIASPTIELYVASYNVTHTALINLSLKTYGFKADNANEELSPNDNYGIYNKGEGTYWWISSPGWHNIVDSLMIDGDEKNFYFCGDVYNESASIRPIVCLPATEITDSVLHDE